VLELSHGSIESCLALKGQSAIRNPQSAIKSRLDGVSPCHFQLIAIQDGHRTASGRDIMRASAVFLPEFPAGTGDTARMPESG